MLEFYGKIAKERRGRGFINLAGLICLAWILHSSVVAAQRTLLQEGIADEVLRFHVLANSDSEEDQRIKLAVRDGVLEWIEEELEKENGKRWNEKRMQKKEGTREEMKRFLSDHLPELTETADKILAEQGVSYRSAAAVETCYFPDRTYGDCTFPAGYYEALRIRLGEAKGHNWWCVLYPQLCFTDCLHAVVEEDEMQKLEEVLTVEEYECLLREPEKWKIRFRWF